MIFRQQIGQVMNIVCSTWHRWAQKLLWQVPELNIVVLQYQSTIEFFNGLWIEKV
jgi:hypothetical protein